MWLGGPQEDMGWWTHVIGRWSPQSYWDDILKLRFDFFKQWYAIKENYDGVLNESAQFTKITLQDLQNWNYFVICCDFTIECQWHCKQLWCWTFQTCFRLVTMDLLKLVVTFYLNNFCNCWVWPSVLKNMFDRHFYLQDHSTEVLHYDQFMSQRVNW